MVPDTRMRLTYLCPPSHLAGVYMESGPGHDADITLSPLYLKSFFLITFKNKRVKILNQESEERRTQA